MMNQYIIPRMARADLQLLAPSNRANPSPYSQHNLAELHALCIYQAFNDFLNVIWFVGIFWNWYRAAAFASGAVD